MKFSAALVVFSLLLVTSITAQQFGTQQVITTNADSARSVYATDLDGDGDADVLSASQHDNKIAWYENLGCGTFATEQTISSNANGARSVYATDLDGDGDADVLAALYYGNKIVWYENLGGGTFGPQQVINTIYAAVSASCVYATDLDGDGDADVLCASESDNKIVWYENLGLNSGTFGSEQQITLNASIARSVYATDLDGDGDADVLSASGGDDKIAWYENQGVNSGTFGAEQTITLNADGATGVYATDLDGDGDADVLSASLWDDKISWYANDGNGNFGTQQVITLNAAGAYSVYATDLDGDGDADVLSASSFDAKIAWYENTGSGTFGSQQVITTNANGAYSVYATDLDGDGDADVLSASLSDDKIAWYENLTVIPPPAPVVSFSGGTLNTTITWGAAPLTIDFHDQSTNNPTSWLWDFGDGNTSSDQHPTHTYTTLGTYTVTLTATNAGGSNTASLPNYITVNPPVPVVSFTGTPTTGIAPLTVSFTDQSTNNPTTWWWDFNDGTGLWSYQNPTHTFTTPGTYTVTLTADNASGSGSVTYTNYITVHPQSWHLSLTETPSYDLHFDFELGTPNSQYYAFYSLNALNASSPGTGFAAGLHISLQSFNTQLLNGINGHPIFGGVLDGSGSAAAIYNQPGLGALHGITLWGVAIQVNPSISNGFEASPITSLTFL